MRTDVAIVIMLILTQLNLSLYAQKVVYPNKSDSSIVKVRGYYKKLGKVFPWEDEDRRDCVGNKIQSKYFIEENKKELIMTKEIILEVESILHADYENYLKQVALRNNHEYVKGIKPKKKFKNRYRSYYGYIDSNEEAIVVVLLELVFKPRSKTDYWRRCFSFMHEEPPGIRKRPFKQYHYFINISKGVIIVGR